MIDKIYKCVLDLSTAGRHSIPNNMVFSIRDELTSIITFEFKNGDVSDSNISIYIRKPDNTIIFNNIPLQDNLYIYELTSQSKAVEGVYTAELRIQLGNEVRTLKGISYTIDSSDINENAIESSNEFGALAELVATAEARILETKTYQDNAKVYQDNAKISEDNAKLSENNAKSSEVNINELILKTPYIGEDGFWYVWDKDANKYVKSGRAIGNVYETFEINFNTGELIMTQTTDFERLTFNLSDDGYLEVSL